MSTKGNAESFVEMRGSLKIPDLIVGKSAYEIAVMHGFQGTEEEWIKHVTAEADRSEAEANRAQTEADRAKSEADRAMEKDPTVPAWAKQPSKPSYTPAEVGAAPAGFGLGEYAKLLTADDDLNTCLKGGWYAWRDVIPNNALYGWGMMEVVPFGSGEGCLQRSYCIVSGHENIIAQRFMRAWGTWTEWEYLNPSMLLGVEYRTTERFNGNPVYVVAMDLGTLPTSGDKDVYYPVSLNCENIVSYDVIISNHSYGARSLPTFASDGSVMAYAWSLNATIRITVLRDMSGYNGRAIVKYTKD